MDPGKWIKKYKGINAINKNEFLIDVGYERFLGPEIFFHPEVERPLFLNYSTCIPRMTFGNCVVKGLFTLQFANPDFLQPISDVVDEVIQNCPIDVRRPLYKVKYHYYHAILVVLFNIILYNIMKMLLFDSEPYWGIDILNKKPGVKADVQSVDRVNWRQRSPHFQRL